jgi:TatD DNase family protein
MIDSHCHLTYEPLSARIDAVLARAAEAGVSGLVTVGTSVTDTHAAMKLATIFSAVRPTAGVHPHEAGQVDEGWSTALEALARDPAVVAVGETGLDYHYDFADHTSQRRVFERQLKIALDVNKPVIIHCREAHADTLDVLAQFPHPERVVFHCFTGTPDEARQILERGCWISLTGVVTFKKSDALREVAAFIPADRLMVETDSPYLSPEPVRGVRPNEPAHVVHTAARIAQVRGLTYDQLDALTSDNARQFFGL